ncbi:MAG: flagellar basal body rod protein FlgB [Candidatus Desulforudis sp.]|nr:flagellar basal body rod protein FlgB [Desulforudis sp.]
MINKDPIMTMLTRALDAEALRQRVIADNIANLNTPGFKRSQVDFRAFMDAALSGAPGCLKQTDPRHLPGRTGGGARPHVEQVATSHRADGNNVDLDREMIELVENALGYQAVSQFWTSKFGIYSQVIKGGR